MPGFVRALCATALAVVCVSAVPTAASAAVDTTCGYSKAKHLVTLRLPDADADETPVWLGRVPGAKRIGFDTDSIDWKVCGAATVTNTNTIRVVGTQQSEELVITLEGGPLAPGFSHERRGSSEIELAVDLGSGTDEITLLGGDGPDHLGFPRGGRGTLNGDDDVDITIAGADRWTLDGGIGNDVLDGSGAPQLRAYGREGSDRITGGAGRDYLVGDEGEAASADGNDTVVGGDGDDSVTAGGGNDRLLGGAGDDYLRAGGGRDQVFGGADSDWMPAESTADGADVVRGGTESDAVSYSERQRALRISLDNRANDGVTGERDDIGSDVESIYGGARGDTVVGSSSGNYLVGGTGDDTLRGMGGNDTLNPGDGDDDMFGGDGGDSFYTSLGTDRAFGEGGDDSLNAGSTADGRDVYSGGSGVDSMSYSQRTGAVTIDVTSTGHDGEAGENDDVKADFEYLTAGGGDDTVAGGSLGEQVNGGNGADTLSGGRGADSVHGGAGDDHLSGGEGYDTLYGEDGDDVIGAMDDAADSIDCGWQVVADTANTDGYDDVVNCEVVNP